MRQRDRGLQRAPEDRSDQRQGGRHWQTNPRKAIWPRRRGESEGDTSSTTLGEIADRRTKPPCIEGATSTRRGAPISSTRPVSNKGKITEKVTAPTDAAAQAKTVIEQLKK
jgi:hypothetical protein